MSFFERYFEDTIFEGEETMVCCPFPHNTDSGLEYFESNPSAGVNLDKRVFHCLSCGRAHSEVSFIKEILTCSYETAGRIKNVFDTNDDINAWKEFGTLPSEVKTKILDLGISEEVIEELSIRSEDKHSISFPVPIFGQIVDMRNYRPNERPKIKSRFDAISGLIIPFDVVRQSDPKRWVLLCAGEKDMAVARTHGFNAITLTGGEQSLPVILAPFKDRKVAIVYDNDDAGRMGAKRVAAHIREYAKEVRIVTAFHEICKEKGEDLTDFFTKYKGTADMLKAMIASTPVFNDEHLEEILEAETPTMTLIEAARPKYINKTVRSNIQIIATNEASFVVPTVVEARKGISKEGDLLREGEKKHWYLSEDNAKDILHLIDNKFTEDQIRAHLKDLLGIPQKEGGIKLWKLSREVVYKCTVSDMFETSTENAVNIEYNAYVIGKKLDSGKKYKATYKLVPHPYDGQRLIMIIFKVSEANDSVSNFSLTEENKEHLAVVRNLPGNVEEKIDYLTNLTRGLTKYNTDATLVQTIDFSFNTVLEFNFQNFKNVRGYLDSLLVTESRVGKSSTAEALQKVYGLGVFTSLAGSSATVAGIIGGSNKVGGTFQTRAGLIPQNHKGLIIFEELAKCNAQILKELTDVKSSGRARITRVNGALDLPALVRMIAFTNPKSQASGIPRPITSYPNGIEVLTELIGTAEDIARFDIMLVLAYRETAMDPDWVMPEPLPEEVYKTRIRWIWSRKPEQVVFAPGVERYIILRCNDLNRKYGSHIKIFGTEAWKKVSRLAIAAAGTLVSTDDTFEKIIITEEHVDYAINFLTRIYDNDTFRLKEYVDAEKRYESVDENGIKALQQMYLTFPMLLVQLETSSNCTRQELMASTGLPQDQFSQQLNLLVQHSFIRFQGPLIVPSLRFRKSMKEIDRTAVVKLGGPSNVFKV